jgi:hypothetical protein
LGGECVKCFGVILFLKFISLLDPEQMKALTNEKEVDEITNYNYMKLRGKEE